MIRILLVDDHPALRAGLTAVLRAEPGLVPLGTAASEEELWPALRRTKPDVVVLDYHLPPADGLHLCRRIKKSIPAPGVLLYSAYADAQLVIPGLLAGADGVVNKGAAAGELYDAIRTVARGDKIMPPLSRELLDDANGRLDSSDLPILGMALDGTSEGEIARTLGVSSEDISQRVDRMITRLKVEVPVPREG
jgi:DNA-binding NarL/FixJ family response regulator